MVALPLKPEYRPTLGELLAPRWRRAPRPRRLLLALALLVASAVVVAAVLALLPPSLSYRTAAVSFSFRYRGLQRTAPEAGGYARLRRLQDGRLRDSMSVSPLLLAPYRGEPTPALALYAAGYIHTLAAHTPGFELRGEGWSQVDSISPYAVYNIFFTTLRHARELYGRDILLLPQRPGARRGVTIALLADPGSEKQLTSPLLLGTIGALEGPLVSFRLD
jgi:hypothetical protein